MSYITVDHCDLKQLKIILDLIHDKSDEDDDDLPDMHKIMKNQYNTVTVVKWFCLDNGWEYYVTDKPVNNRDKKFKRQTDAVWAVVCGAAIEYGVVHMHEIPSDAIVFSTTKDDGDLQPADGWTWGD